MTKYVGTLSLGVTVVAVGAALVALQLHNDGTTMEDVGEQIAMRIMEILPRKTKSHTQTTAPLASNLSDNAVDSIRLSKGSIFDPVGHYNAKEAMQKRFEGLREACSKFSDFLRPERMMVAVTPEIDEVLYDAASDIMFCPINKVASKNFRTLFDQIRDHSNERLSKQSTFKQTYPRSAKDSRKAIVVRHPLERLVSAYRYTYEKSYNAISQEEEGGEISFPDFVDLLLNGPLEYAEFLEENGMEGTSAAIDTGLIDGLGVSNAWNPYWKQCGVCNPDMQPHYILHLDHYQQDLQALIEVMGYPDKAKRFLDLDHQVKSGLREVEEHYFSQLTKSEIRQLHEKYRADHELFGFSPDYYIAMGQDE